MLRSFQRLQDHVWPTASGMTRTLAPMDAAALIFSYALNDNAGSFLLSLAFISHKTRSFPFESRSILSRTRHVHFTKAQSCSSKWSRSPRFQAGGERSKQTNKQTYFHWTFSSHDNTVPRLYYFITSRKLKHSSIYTHFRSNTAIKVAPTPHYNWLQRAGFVDRHIYICTATLHLQNW